MTKDASISLPQRLALDLQSARTNLQQERERVHQLLQELDRLNGEVDRLRGSMHRESNSRLQAEEALNETRDRLQLAVEAAGLALWEWEVGSTEAFLSARWGELMGGIALEGHWELAGLLDRLHPEDRQTVEERFRGLLQQDGVRAVAEYRIRVDGGWVWIESHGMVAERDRNGCVLRLMGTHADISERKRIEASGVRARELAEQASRAKSDFLANISHEVRTPLNAIMGLNTLLLNSSLNDEQRRWLELMDSSAHTLLALLNDVLDFSRMDAGKLRLEDQPFDLARELKNMAALYKGQAIAKSVEFALDLSPDLMLQVRGDALRLRQVLGNLLSNALKFTPTRGRIEMRARLVWPDGPAASWLELAIQDTGVGIARDQQATIFEAFTQADASTTRHYGGSGLGLAICARLVQLMDGRIGLQSEPGQGSCFTVLLPLRADSPMAAPARVRPESPALESSHSFSGLSVLVADDHPVNELLLNRLLQKLGCSVRSASHGEGAVAQWEQGGLDLVLMDVQMPGTNGLQATQRIRTLERERGLPRTPIVAVTANAMHGDRDRYLASGFDSYASKPIALAELLQAMKSALDAAASPMPTPTPERSKGQAPQPGAVALAQSVAAPSNLTALLGDDAQALALFAQRLKASLAEEMGLLRTACEARSLEQVLFAIHRLNNSLALISADRATRLCKGLELSARSGDWALYQRALPLLEKEVLTSLAASTPPVV